MTDLTDQPRHGLFNLGNPFDLRPLLARAAGFFASWGMGMAKRKARVTLAGSPARVEREPDVREVALAQPHRRGSSDHRCATSFGRFCIGNRLNQGIYTAGEEYRATTQRWRILKGIPLSVASDNGGEGGGELDDDTIRAIRDHMMRMEHVMAKASLCGYYALRGMILDDFEIAMDEDGPAVQALEALAIHLGLLTHADGPFASGMAKAA